MLKSRLMGNIPLTDHANITSICSTERVYMFLIDGVLSQPDHVRLTQLENLC
jgi:hypothetical protein